MSDEIPNYLFVCLINKNRSVIGKSVFTRILKERGLTDFVVNSAGINVDEEKLQNKVQVTVDMVEEADFIFGMTADICRTLISDYEAHLYQIVNLAIPDNYKFDVVPQNLELRGIFRDILMEYVPN